MGITHIAITVGIHITALTTIIGSRTTAATESTAITSIIIITIIKLTGYCEANELAAGLEQFQAIAEGVIHVEVLIVIERLPIRNFVNQR